MDTFNSDLEKEGIKVICPISTLNVNEIATLNNISNPNLIYPGQTIKIV